MRRRAFVAGALLATASAWAQQARTRKIGYLHPRTAAADSPTLSVLRPVWERLGYVEGVSILLRSADGAPERLRELAAELVHLGASVVIAVGPAAVSAAARTGVNVVAIDQESDPVRTGLAASFGRPGANVTGLFVDQPSLAGKMVDLLIEAAPAVRRIGVVSTASTTNDQLNAARAAARARSLESNIVVSAGAERYDAVFGSFGWEVPTGLVQLGAPGFILDASAFALAASKHKLPHIAVLKAYVREGMMMSYGPRQEAYFPRAVLLAERIVRGERAADLPIEQPAEFELAVNLRTARVIGVEFPPSLLARADEVIE